MEVFIVSCFTAFVATLSVLLLRQRHQPSTVMPGWKELINLNFEGESFPGLQVVEVDAMDPWAALASVGDDLTSVELRIARIRSELGLTVSQISSASQNAAA